jgi:predicted acylesterase/phospholipase RssA
MFRHSFSGYVEPIALTSFVPWFVAAPRRPISACFGGGGAFGIGFNLGVADGLIEGGIPVDHGPMLGTSAGSWAAAALATGISCDEIFDMWDANADMPRPARVIDATRPFFGARSDRRVSAMVVHVPSGRRLALSGSKHSLADLVAASSSPPRLARPHRIGRQWYVDGGVSRVTSADRAKSARVLVVVTPIGGRVLGAFGRISERVTRYEMAQWRQRTGGHVLFVRPTRKFGGVFGTGGLEDLLDVEVGRRTYRAAFDLGSACAERFRKRHSDAAEHLTMAAIPSAV